MPSPEVVNRRELKTRGRGWPRAIAGRLAAAGVTPNQVSLLSIVFALAGCAAFAVAGNPDPSRSILRLVSGRDPDSSRWLLLLLAAACIQLRLLCNLLDGLLAIEGGLRTSTGDLFNEIPDRVADVAILLGAGFAVRALPLGVSLGWMAALAAVLTAYVRLLGGSLGLVQDFTGPMAKQHRMFTLTVGALGAAAEHAARGTAWTLYAALWIIVLGSALTLARRTMRIARQLETR